MRIDIPYKSLVTIKLMKHHKFGILGYGYVGRATHLSLCKNQKVIIYDIKKSANKNNLSTCDTIFICIPTNTQKDIKKLFREIKDIYKLNPKIQFIIRSTLPIGTCDLLKKHIPNLIYIPEFLRERFWKKDCLKRPLVVGYDGGKLPSWLTKEKIIKCTMPEAEIIKMFTNNLAVFKITFANIFYDIANATNSDYDKIKNAFLQVSHDQNYIEMPGHDGRRGFGGKCLPKDSIFLQKTLSNYNIDNKLIKIINRYNDKWRKKS